MTNRRDFLQISTALTGILFVPQYLFTSLNLTFHFIQATTLNSLSIANPARWCLDHKHDPILERAFDDLCPLSVNDPDRIVRRCGLNFVEVQSKPINCRSLIATFC